MKKLKELREKRDRIRAELLEESKAAFTDITKSIFDKYPKLEWFAWSQYTPYFNDGDECVFGANTADIDVRYNGKQAEYISAYQCDPARFKECPGLGDDPEAGVCILECLSLLEEIGDDEYKEMFGDHVEVRVGRAGTIVKSYDHD